MASYRYSKELYLNVAFDDFLKKNFPDSYINFDGVPPFTENLIDIVFNRELTQEEHDNLTTLITNYVNPSYWLAFSRTDNMFVNSLPINSSIPSVAQTFIISPYNQGFEVMGDMKTIIKYESTDTFSNFNSSIDNITCTIQLFDYTNNNVIVNIESNINDIIDSWKNGQSNPTWKTYQIYGLKDANPGSDAIWQIKLSVSDPRVNVTLNGMQRIFYNIIN